MSITTVELACGMPLVVERVPNVASAALEWFLPGGSASDPVERDGVASMLAEMVFRGAGGLDSRGHSDALDRCGVQRSCTVEVRHVRLSARMLASRLNEALPLVVSMVREPAFPDEALEPVRSLALQTLASLDDDPQHMVMLRLRDRHLPPPFNRHGYGSEAGIGGASIDDLRAAWRRRAVPRGAILAAAGDIDPAALAKQLDTLMEGWTGAADEATAEADPARGEVHLEQDTNQVHIGVAFDAPAEPHDDSMLERLLIRVLSGGTSARLFTEVRQKRSLCYSVGASYDAGRDYGVVTLYAGTTPERAQETLDVSLAEFDRIRAGFEDDEFARAVVGLKSRLVMQGESTRARAGALAWDQYRLGRPRSLEEVAASVDAVSADALRAYAAQRVFSEPTVSTIGPAPLAVPRAVER